MSSYFSLRIHIYNPKVHLLIKEKVTITVKMYVNTDTQAGSALFHKNTKSSFHSEFLANE